MYSIVIGVSSLPPLAVTAVLFHQLAGWLRERLYRRAHRSMGGTSWGW